MSQEIRAALMVLSPAMATAVVFLLLSWRPWQHGAAAAQHGYWGGSLALGLGFVAAFYFVAGSRGFQLQDRWHWIVPIALAALALGFIASLSRTSTSMRFATVFALALACGVLLHPPAVAGPALYWKIGLGVVVLTSWSVLEPIAHKRRGVTLPITLMIVFSGLSVVLLETQQAGFSLLAAAMAAMCGVALVIALFNPQFTFAHGGIHVVAATMPTLCVLGWHYNFSEVPAGPFVLITASSLMLTVGEAWKVADSKLWQGVLLRTVLVAIPIAGAVVWTLMMSASGTP